jgi:hypothetical protein
MSGKKAPASTGKPQTLDKSANGLTDWTGLGSATRRGCARAPCNVLASFHELRSISVWYRFGCVSLPRLLFK